MKKTLFSVLFTLALCLAALPASAQEDVYTLLGPDGRPSRSTWASARRAL